MDDLGEQLPQRGLRQDTTEDLIAIVLSAISIGLACLALLYLP